MAKGISFSMGETVGSLRLYFFLLALFGGVLNALILFKPPPGVSAAFALVGVLIAGAHLFLALRLETLIVEAPRRVEWVLLASGALAIANLVVSLAGGNMIFVGQSVVILAIVWYLIANVRRLASEAAQSAPGPHSNTPQEAQR